MFLNVFRIGSEWFGSIRIESDLFPTDPHHCENEILDQLELRLNRIDFKPIYAILNDFRIG